MISFAVLVFKIKEYKLLMKGKKQMPICRNCQVGFTNWTEYNTHLVRRHRGNDKYVCLVEGCNKEFKTLSSYKMHEYYHEEDKKHFQCKVHKVKFTFELQLDRHMDSHTDNKPFKCALKTCPKFVEGFKSQQLLNRYMDIHVGKHILCTVEDCTKAFPTKAYLKEHMNMKHGWPYQCQHVLDGCKFTCKSHKTLNDHHKFYLSF